MDYYYHQLLNFASLEVGGGDDGSFRYNPLTRADNRPKTVSS